MPFLSQYQTTGLLMGGGAVRRSWQLERGIFFRNAGMIPRKLYKIGEVMRYSGLSRQTVHNYTMMGLIKPLERTESGHRLYPEDVFEDLRTIMRLRRHHTLSEIKTLLKKLKKRR
ncbi:MAG: hypothetical protein DRP79_09205 [Planctomycetota bacterium]|nr:MAG: hypothetical protein DRP79_09205 [Planctomycetota bacterium]